MLCPFCDESWPENPTAKLIALTAKAFKHTFPSPRTTNPNGRSSSSFLYFIQVCNQHRNETTTIPQGLCRGWPREIDFEALPNRICIFKSQLAMIMKDPGSSSFFRDAIHLQMSSPLFASSIEGQQLIFKKSQPG